MLCEPTASAGMRGKLEGTVSVATPLALSVPVPRVVEPSLNVTVPVGVPVPLVGLTVAVKVTFCPTVDGFGLEVMVVVVAMLLTVRVKFWVAGLPTPLEAVKVRL